MYGTQRGVQVGFLCPQPWTQSGVRCVKQVLLNNTPMSVIGEIEEVSISISDSHNVYRQHVTNHLFRVDWILHQEDRLVPWTLNTNDETLVSTVFGVSSETLYLVRTSVNVIFVNLLEVILLQQITQEDNIDVIPILIKSSFEELTTFGQSHSASL